MKRPFGLVLALALLALTSSMAIIYRSKATKLRVERNKAIAEADTLRQAQADPSTPRPEEVDEKAVLRRDPEPASDDVRERRVQELEEKLLLRDQTIASLKAQLEQPAPTNQVPSPENRRDWLEEIKETDPERYKEIIERREAGRDRMRDQFARKAAHLLDKDTSDMTEAEQEEYGLMLQILEETWALAEQMQADMPREEHRALFRELRDKMEMLNPLLVSERDKQFYQLGLDFGYDVHEAAQFVDYLNGVFELTSVHSFWPRRKLMNTNPNPHAVIINPTPPPPP